MNRSEPPEYYDAPRRFRSDEEREAFTDWHTADEDGDYCCKYHRLMAEYRFTNPPPQPKE